MLYKGHSLHSIHDPRTSFSSAANCSNRLQLLGVRSVLVCLIAPSGRGDAEALKKEVFQGSNPKGQPFYSKLYFHSNPSTPDRLPCLQSRKPQNSTHRSSCRGTYPTQGLWGQTISLPGNSWWNSAQVTRHIHNIALSQSQLWDSTVARATT